MTDYVKIIVILISHFQHFSTSSLLDSFASPHYLRRFPPKSYTRSSVCECVSECARMYVSPTPKPGQQSCSTFSLQKVAMRELFPVVSARSTSVSACGKRVRLLPSLAKLIQHCFCLVALYSALSVCFSFPCEQEAERERTREMLPTSDSGWSDLWRALCRKGQQMFIELL